MLYECEFCGTLRHPTYTQRTTDGVWFCEKCRALAARREKVLLWERAKRAEEWDEAHTITLLLRLVKDLEEHPFDDRK